MILSVLFTCTGMLIGLGFVGVGAAVVRKANPMSGYLFIGAGALMILLDCCTFGASPDRLHGFGVDADMLSVAILLRVLAQASEVILVAILLAVAFVGLAKKVPQGGAGY